ncbi:hypothetical protein EJ110_NYTH42167 [Nymphaea thermarum]|nr:hypothetical protein EJ110_NYTH42167 [Nymphaea thermarum]
MEWKDEKVWKKEEEEICKKRSNPVGKHQPDGETEKNQHMTVNPPSDDLLKFIKGLQLQFKLVSRNTVISYCIHSYKDEMTKLHNIVEKTNGRISLTSDMWTSSCQKRGY